MSNVLLEGSVGPNHSSIIHIVIRTVDNVEYRRSSTNSDGNI